jgi:hypothetical protein
MAPVASEVHAMPEASGEIEARIADLGGWRGATLATARQAILAADDGIIETVKWRKPSNPAGVPVWEKRGVLCTGEVYKDKVKLTFPKGASLSDPQKLFNASLEGNTRRAIDLFEGDDVNAAALSTLVREAIAANAG